MNRRQALLAATMAPPSARAGADGTALPLRWPPLHLLDGRVLSPADWHGQAAVLVFWATWCAFCKRHNRHLDTLHQATRGQPLRVLGIALDSDADLVRRTVAAQGWRFPVAMDGGALRDRLAPRRVLPSTCVVDRGGRVLQVIPGEMTEADVLDLARLALRPAA